MDKAAHWKAKPHAADYDEMRARLIDAAWEMACASGVRKLTLNGVARQADCARSSVYRYFDSKEQLLGEVLRERVMALGQELEQELARYADPREQIVQGVYRTVLLVKEGPSLELFRLLSQEESGDLAGILMEQIPAMASQLLSIDPLFHRARASGDIRDGLTDDDILRWLVTVAISLVQQPGFGEDSAADTAYLHKMLVPSIFRDQ